MSRVLSITIGKDALFILVVSGAIFPQVDTTSATFLYTIRFLERPLQRA
jgi:hypothetical protein